MSDSAADPFGTALPLDTVTSRPRAGTVLFEVDGEVDSLTAARLETRLGGALDTGRTESRTVVVDLTGVTFLASSGLAVLIDGARRATAAGGRLHVVAATRAVSRPMQIIGADALVDMHADVGSALDAAAPSGVPPGVAPPAAGVGR